jgi:ubiquinone/menaquinone biosynthesis C-methylase UbiE
MFLPADKRKMPYEQIAEFYDEMMSHVDYGEWVYYVRKIWNRHVAGELTNCLDTACGTGRFLERLRPHIDEVAGADYSASMLAIAAKRLKTLTSDNIAIRELGKGKASLYHMDLRSLQTTVKFDLITCLYDSINYMVKPADFERVLGRFAGCLNRDGLLIFDICTKRNSVDHFLDMYDRGICGNWKYERHSWYEMDNGLHHNDFKVWALDSDLAFSENHLQRIYSVKQVERLITKVGLELKARYADFGFKRGNESADRVHFVCALKK